MMYEWALGQCSKIMELCAAVQASDCWRRIALWMLTAAIVYGLVWLSINPHWAKPAPQRKRIWTLIGSLFGCGRSSPQAKLGEHLRIVAVDLAFPAILGTILYDTISEAMPPHSQPYLTLLIAIKIGIVCHYVSDFIYLKVKYAKAKYVYVPAGYFLDFFDAALTYSAARILFIGTTPGQFRLVAFLYSLTYLSYLAWDYHHRQTGPALWHDLSIAGLFLLCAVFPATEFGMVSLVLLLGYATYKHSSLAAQLI